MNAEQLQILAGAAACMTFGVLLLVSPAVLQLEHWSKDKRTALAVCAFIVSLVIAVTTALS